MYPGWVGKKSPCGSVGGIVGCHLSWLLFLWPAGCLVWPVMHHRHQQHHHHHHHHHHHYHRYRHPQMHIGKHNQTSTHLMYYYTRRNLVLLQINFTGILINFLHLTTFFSPLYTLVKAIKILHLEKMGF